MRFVAAAEICDGVFRPLIRFREQHAPRKFLIDMRAQVFQIDVGLGQILAIGPFALVEIRHGIEPQTINAHLQPVIANFLHRLMDGRVIEIQIWLMRIKAVPIVRFRNRVP